MLDKDMVVSFSSGYYLDRLYVEFHDTERALLNDDYVADLNETIYFDPEETLYRTDIPVIVRVGIVHFVAHPSAEVPFGSLQVPPTEVKSPDVPGRASVLIAKKDRVSQLAQFTVSDEEPESPSL